MRSRERDELPGGFLLPVALALVPVVLFWSAASLRGSFFYGDVLRIYYPLKAALAEALAAGRLPLWTSDIMGGYPLLAEGEGGFLYPIGLLLSLLVKPVVALNWQMLLHLAIAGLGMYAYCRSLRLDSLSATVGGLIYMLCGFTLGHLDHLSVTSAAAWLPWLFLLVELLTTRERVGLHAALLALLVGLQFSAGHAQISFLSLMALGLYALFKTGCQFLDGEGLGRPLSLLLVAGVAVVLGALVAAPQLLPTLELSDRSVRAGGLTGSMLTSFSLPPPYVITFFSPFLAGNPLASLTPAAAVEWCGYVGILPLLLALYAVIFRHDRYTVFFAVLALLALVFAFGQYNPLYQHLAEVPIFNSFRVPARFLLPYSFALAALAALGTGNLLRPGLPLSRAPSRALPVALGLIALLLWGLTIVSARDLTQLLTLWQFLPWALLVLGSLLLLARGRLVMDEAPFALLLVALVGVDLYAFSAVFGGTFNATTGAGVLRDPPHIVSALLAREENPYRVYTRERIIPSAPGVRESLFPNFALAAGVPSLNGYLPLALSAYDEFEARLAVTPRLADISAVKYLLVPQSVANDETTVRDNLANPYAPSPVGRRLEVPATRAVALEIESFLSMAADVPEGTVVADVVVSDGAREEVLPLRAGVETAEWAYDRPDVRVSAKHQRPAPHRTFPASSGAPPVEHNGHTYLAKLQLSREMVVTSLSVRTVAGTGILHADRVSFVDGSGQRQSLAHLVGWGDYEIAYRSEAVVAFRNRQAMPRAFLVHTARSADQPAEVWRHLLAPDFDPAAEVVLGPAEARGPFERLLALNPFAGTTYGQLPSGNPAARDYVQIVSLGDQEASLRASLTSPGYLVLSDTYYPGWQVYVDGQRAPLQRANWLYRAVELPAGEHKVEFRYEPAWWGLSWLLATLGVLAIIVLTLRLPSGATGSHIYRPT